MRSFVFAVLVIVLSAYLQCQAHNSDTVRIVGGENATDGEFPYMVSLRGDNQYHTCGGSIIGSRWILTAGHCVLFATNVRYGSVLLNDGGKEQTVKVKRQIQYPSWSTDVIPYNDLGILELEDPLVFNNYVQPVKLPYEHDIIPFNYTSTLCGWGLMENQTQTDHLQKVNLTLFDDNYCESQLNINADYFISSMCTCAGDWKHSKGQCTMDSGGPLVINGVQWGIVSWSYKPCGSLPGAFARLANHEYQHWIRNITGI